MNWERGLFRVWMVGSIVWAVAWVGYIWGTCELKHVPGTREGTYITMCYTGFSGWMTQYPSFTVLDYASIAVSGASVPVAVLLLGLVIRWIARGFGARVPSK